MQARRRSPVAEARDVTTAASVTPRALRPTKNFTRPKCDSDKIRQAHEGYRSQSVEIQEGEEDSLVSVCFGMPPLSLRFRKRTRRGADSGTKTEVSHGECEDRGASSDRPSTRPGVSCRGEAVGPQRAPKPRPYPWDTSVFVPESCVRGVLFARRSKVPVEYQAVNNRDQSSQIAEEPK